MSAVESIQFKRSLSLFALQLFSSQHSPYRPSKDSAKHRTKNLCGHELTFATPKKILFLMIRVSAFNNNNSTTQGYNIRFFAVVYCSNMFFGHHFERYRQYVVRYAPVIRLSRDGSSVDAEHYTIRCFYALFSQTFKSTWEVPRLAQVCLPVKICQLYFSRRT